MVDPQPDGSVKVFAYLGMKRNPDGLNPIVGITGDNTWVGFKYFNFGTNPVVNADMLKLNLNGKVINPTQISVWVALPKDANVANKRIDIAKIVITPHEPNNVFQEIEIPIPTIENNEQLATIGGLKGKLALFLSFNGGSHEVFQLKELEFVKHDTHIPVPFNSK